MSYPGSRQGQVRDEENAPREAKGPPQSCAKNWQLCDSGPADGLLGSAHEEIPNRPDIAHRRVSGRTTSCRGQQRRSGGAPVHLRLRSDYRRPWERGIGELDDVGYRAREEERRFNAVDFRNEIEFGVTEHFQIGLYLADWGYREDPTAHEHGFSYQTSALELIYNLSNPTTDLLGSALYGEVRGGPEELELESKIILQKNLGRFVVAYNGTLEAKWEGDRLEERGGEFSQSLGVSYEVSPALLRRRGASA